MPRETSMAAPVSFIRWLCGVFRLCRETIGKNGHLPKTNINLSVCPRTDRLCVELRRLAEDGGAAYADPAPVRLHSSHSSGSGEEFATWCDGNAADARAAIVTVVIVVAARP